MPVGVERLSHAHTVAYGVAQGVVHLQIDNQIVAAARGGIHKMLNVKARQIVRRIVLSVHWQIAIVAVGVESGSGTHQVMYGVVQGVDENWMEHHTVHKPLAIVRRVHKHPSGERFVAAQVGVAHRIAFHPMAAVAEIPHHAVVVEPHIGGKLDGASGIEEMPHSEGVLYRNTVDKHIDIRLGCQEMGIRHHIAEPIDKSKDFGAVKQMYAWIKCILQIRIGAVASNRLPAHQPCRVHKHLACVRSFCYNICIIKKRNSGHI